MPKAHIRLFIPGPTEVRPDVLAAMARPLISHRGPEISALQQSVVEKAARVMFTDHPVLLSTSSATGLMEAGIRNAVKRRVLSLVCGAFSRRWHQIALDCGKEADPIEVPWGEAIRPEQVDEALATGRYDAVTVAHCETSTGVANPLAEIARAVRRHEGVVLMVDTVSSLGGMPVKVDELGIDLCLASVQKAMALPPGFSLCSVSSGIVERSRAARDKGFYFDFVRMLDKAASHQSVITPSISHMFAMDVQLSHMLEEGMENRWERHRRMGEMVRSWARDRFELFAGEDCASDTLTCIRNTRGISIKRLVDGLREDGMLIGNGYGDLKEKTFRIAHLGELQPGDIEELLGAVDRRLDG